ncbi:hypothetical protein H5410_057035, partial [Solanum commersonii]
ENRFWQPRNKTMLAVNAIFDALPTYMLSLFPFPSSVVQRLDKIKRSSLWLENKEKKVFYLVKWMDIIRSKKQGGLGIRKLKHQCKDFKIKWLWIYAQEPQTLWGSVIKSKYGEEDCWVSKEVTAYGVNLWRSIRSSGLFLQNT